VKKLGIGMLVADTEIKELGVVVEKAQRSIIRNG